MTCDDVRALYLERDFDASALEAAARIAAHLAQCSACRQTAGQYDQLRQLLKAPADEDAVGPEPAELSPPVLGLAKPSPTRPLLLSNRLALGLAAATLLLLALVGWGFYFANRHDKPMAGPQIAGPKDSTQPWEAHDGAAPPPDAVVTADLHWTRADVDRGAALFTKVSESFDGRAGWVAVGDRASDVGLIAGPAAQPPKVLLVRLLMSQGGRSPSKTDLVIVPGQEVSVELPFQPGEVLRYRIKTTPGTQPRLTLAAEVRSIERGETLAALATQLQPQAGEALSAGRLSSQSGPYNLDVSFSETALSTVH